MSLSQLLNQAVELKLLSALDRQFAMMVASDEQPAVMPAAALLSSDAGEGHVCLPLSRLALLPGYSTSWSWLAIPACTGTAG